MEVGCGGWLVSKQDAVQQSWHFGQEGASLEVC